MRLPNCEVCQMKGLPIMPVLYAIVPSSIKPTLPPGIGGERVKDVAVDPNQYAYGLRVLRAGYLYVLYEKRPNGMTNYWEVYTVTSSGRLWLNDGLQMRRPLDEEPQCTTALHLSARNQYLVIEKPEECGPVWLAFSEHRWSPATYNRYTIDTTLRAARMQPIDPTQWLQAPAQPHAVAANRENLKKVMEYTPTLRAQIAPREIKPISTAADGSYSATELARHRTRYNFSSRSDIQLRDVLIQMQSSATVGRGTHQPMLLALWDAIGIAKELINFRNQVAGSIEQYANERSLQVSAMRSIESAQKLLEEARVKEHQEFRKAANSAGRSQSWTAEDEKRRTAIAQTLPEPQRSQELEFIALRNMDAKNNVPAYLTAARERAHRQPDPHRRLADLAAADRSIRELLAKRSTTLTDAKEWGWNKRYERHIDRGALNAFRRNYDQFLQDAATLVDERTESLLRWVKSDLFLDALEDFDQCLLDDAGAFENVIGEVLFGITSSKTGAAHLHQWSCKTKIDRNNLLLRAFSGNQQDAKKELEVALVAAAENASKPLSSADVPLITSIVKQMAKFADVAKKSLSYWNANHKKGVDPSLDPSGMDKLFLTAGHIFFFNRESVTKAVDTVGDYIVRSVFLIRAGGEIVKVATEVGYAAYHASDVRHELRAALLAGVAEKRLAEPKLKFPELKQAWEKLSEAPGLQKPDLAFNEKYELRFGIVATLLQAVYVGKMMYDDHPDPKVQSELLTAQLTLTAGAVDLLATAMKGGAGEASLTFQTLKVSGGLLSAAAAGMVVSSGIKRADAAERNGQYGIAAIYRMKAMQDFLAGAASFFATLSYAKPAFDALRIRYPNAALGRLSNFIAWTFQKRALLMMYALRFNLLSLGFSFLIEIVWLFSDSEMTKWCKRNVFADSDEKKYDDAEAQMSEFMTALASDH